MVWVCLVWNNRFDETQGGQFGSLHPIKLPGGTSQGIKCIESMCKKCVGFYNLPILIQVYEIEDIRMRELINV
jgi:hypothetical protein